MESLKATEAELKAKLVDIKRQNAELLEQVAQMKKLLGLPGESKGYHQCKMSGGDSNETPDSFVTNESENFGDDTPKKCSSIMDADTDSGYRTHS